MDSIIPSAPSFLYGYWKPWKEDSNYFDSYCNYMKDVSIAKYQADSVGQYINQASSDQLHAIGELSKEIGFASDQQIQAVNELGDRIEYASERQVQAINELGEKIIIGFNILSNQLSDLKHELTFLNRKVDIQIEQQKVANLLLLNIIDLLRVPDSEKKRQLHIELGCKFFVNAAKDDDLFVDALDELLEAEKLMKQDYFVLHRIGLIYLYSQRHINPQTALDYFVKAAKYASIESDPQAIRLANVLAVHGKQNINTEITTNISAIGLLAADSYDKAALAAYILGDFALSVKHQSKAVKFNNTADSLFFLAKYQARNKEIDLCIENLAECIKVSPIHFLAVLNDFDLLDEPRVIQLLREKNKRINTAILQLIEEWSIIKSVSSKEIIKKLEQLILGRYDKKVSLSESFTKHKIDIEADILKLKNAILELKNRYLTTISLYDFELEKIISNLEAALYMDVETMNAIYERNLKKYIPVQVGSVYGGGIVFYIDESGKHGFIAAEKDQSQSIQWWNRGFLITQANATELGSGYENTKKIVELQGDGIYAAKLCLNLNLNGYCDWFLPSIDELCLFMKVFKKNDLINFAPKSPNYWSSSEINNLSAWAYNLNLNSNINKVAMQKNIGLGGELAFCAVRAIRAF